MRKTMRGFIDPWFIGVMVSLCVVIQAQIMQTGGGNSPALQPMDVIVNLSPDQHVGINNKNINCE